MVAEYFVLIFVCLISIYAIQKRRYASKTQYKMPKGPTGLPILGNLLQIVKAHHLKFSQWAEQYGSLYTIYLGTKPALVLSNVSVMKEVLNSPASTGKFKMETMLLMSGGPYGIMNTVGSAWAEQRQFCLRSLVNFGFGSKFLEANILSECQSLVDTIKEKTSENIEGGIEIMRHLKFATNNTLMTMVLGDRSKYLKEEAANIQEKVLDGLQYTVKSGLGFFPWLKNIAPGLSGYTSMDEACKKLHQFWIDEMNQHMKAHIPDSPGDLMDAYIDKMQTKDTSSCFYGNDGLKNGIGSLVELFEAGNETTAGSLMWLIHYMAVRPDIQEKVHKELDSVLGDSDPSLQHKGRLPYTEAVISESLRICPVAPFGLIHEFMEDFDFQGYHLPKGMLIIANIYHCHHDKNVWGDPEIFRPERFLGEEGEKLKELLVTFQIGKRSCLGEPLAKDIMFLFASKLLHELEIRPVKNVSTEEYLDPDLGLGLLAKSQKLVMKSRF